MATVSTNRARLLLAGPVALIVLVLGAILKPALVYDRFVWQYFWGPIVADASAATGTAVHNGVVAHSGYTLVSEIGYGLILGYLLLVLVTVLKRLDVGSERNFITAFIPFVVGGGLLRVVEDVTAGQAVVTPPLQYLLISPLIYFTMFGIVFGTVIAAVLLQQRTAVTNYRRVVAGVGTVFALGLTAVLLSATGVAAAWMVPASLGLTGGVYLTYYGIVRFLGLPLHTLFSWEGGPVLYGHLLDGSSTALSLSILGYGEKHPVVQFFIATTGNAYTFILLKLVVISGILYYMNDDVRSDDPLFFNLILLGILAVGMGPGIRNMTRAALGV